MAPALSKSGDTGETAIIGDDEHDTRTKKQKMTEKIQFSALCWCIFLAGWNDGTTGPLLPRIQEVYHVGFIIVSLIFIFACLGFISGALANVHLTDRLGFGKTIILGSVCQIIAYTLQSPAPPFPVFVMAFTINGFGVALQDAQANGFVASLQHNGETKMGLLHAAYGAGALIAPLISTQFAQLQCWSFHYLVSLDAKR
ncbi:MFS general substrate transporter [Macrolepiota fuliginosa MF-IS2]|uniref:MFS general substrate transporter n=1 Tax=Macrolepiota fuliginosa MF-IS2 TaxID=1400762 RepID=A0A9P6C3W1_9AGAR|nr:MFS general substrate transporter [Macrolepiota fuliginosa MF-IS2]